MTPNWGIRWTPWSPCSCAARSDAPWPRWRSSRARGTTRGRPGRPRRRKCGSGWTNSDDPAAGRDAADRLVAWLVERDPRSDGFGRARVSEDSADRDRRRRSWTRRCIDSRPATDLRRALGVDRARRAARRCVAGRLRRGARDRSREGTAHTGRADRGVARRRADARGADGADRPRHRRGRRARRRGRGGGARRRVHRAAQGDPGGATDQRRAPDRARRETNGKRASLERSRAAAPRTRCTRTSRRSAGSRC